MYTSSIAKVRPMALSVHYYLDLESVSVLEYTSAKTTIKCVCKCTLAYCSVVYVGQMYTATNEFSFEKGTFSPVYT